MAAPSFPPPPLATALAQGDGVASSAWARWFQQLQSLLGSIAPTLHPSTPSALQQSGAVYQGSGAPSGADGSSGDVYFRTDTPAVANQRLYIKASGSWTGIL